MKKIFVFLIIISLCFNCSNSKRNKTNIHQLIPDSTSIVLKINSLETFKSDINNSSFIKTIATSSFYENFEASLKSLEDFNIDNELLICFNNTKDSSNYTFITKYHDSLIKNTDSIKLYNTVMDSVFVASTSQDIIDNIKIQDYNSITNYNKVLNEDASFSVVLNNHSATNFGNAVFDNASNFTKSIAFDTEITQDQFILNGVSINNDSIQDFLDIFKNTIPQENTIQNITPSSSNGFLSLTYNDFQTLQENLTQYKKSPIDSTQHFELSETLSEVGIIYLDQSKVLALKSIDAFSTNEILDNEENKMESFRDIDIFSFSDFNYFDAIFSPIISFNNASYYINIDDYFIFANNLDALKIIITNYQNGNTYNNDINFQNLKESLSDESSLLMVANSNTLNAILQNTFKETEINLQLNNYKYSGFQIVEDDGFVHFNAAIKKNKTRRQQNTISEEFNVTLESDIFTHPQFVVNHRTKHKDVVVQDINNNLYLISNKGKILWKKQLEGTVLGNIEQVDLYKNGRLQLAFATPNRVYIIDRNGRNVSPFPLKFNNSITQPLSVFDYDNNKNYRFLVTQNNVLNMYDKHGKRVSGFKYNNTNQDIITRPKHFRISNRDYIVFATGNTLKILNRRGQSRITVNEPIEFSGNAIYNYYNQFTTTTKSGDLVQVNLKGVVSKQSLKLGNKHYISATSKTFVSIDDNKLTIKQRTKELDFGNYSTPKIFYINDKIYVTITDLQAQKVYMFDSQSKPISNFPVYGTSTIDFANIDGDSNFEFVTKGETNSIIVYQKN